MTIEEFRAGAAAWLSQHCRPAREVGDTQVSVADQKELQAALYDAGLAGITIPRDYGGQGLTDAELMAFADEARHYDLPLEVFRVGLGMAVPTILEIGTEEQKRRYLPGLLRGEEIWCQLFSEPNAGSDLAGARTRATRDGDGWRLNGQKVWTSSAQFADFGFGIVRTDPSLPKHQGITMMLLDMHAAGVTVRPLMVATGETPFNEIFLDEVYLPHDAVLGELNQGWAAALVTLKHERLFGMSGGAQTRVNPLSFDALVATATELGATARPEVRRSLAKLFAREESARLLRQRLQEDHAAGRDPGSRGSLTKLAAAQIGMFAVDVATQILDNQTVGVPVDSPLSPTITQLVRVLEAGIAGGTNEIQRNIIGERLLGLEREPRFDREPPFDQLPGIAPRRFS